MNNMNPIDQASQPTDLSPADGQGPGQEANSMTDAKRRRLVRGAMAFAPLVLTLRSGAVAAAASCTGAKELVNLTPTGEFPIGGGANLGDTCVTNYAFNGCPPGKINSGTNTFVQVASGSDGNYACKTLTGNVAILSTAAVNSLLPL